LGQKFKPHNQRLALNLKSLGYLNLPKWLEDTGE